MILEAAHEPQVGNEEPVKALVLMSVQRSGSVTEMLGASSRDWGTGQNFSRYY